MYFPKVYRFDKKNLSIFLFIFLFFVTLSADLLHLKAVIFKVKVNHAIALLLIFFSIPIFRYFSINRFLFFCFLLILSSLCISSTFSLVKTRSIGYILVYLFEFFCYFLIPIHFLFRFDHQKIFNAYWLSFKVIGFYAIMQLVFSVFGIMDPFVGQFLGRLARPHAMAYEPSFYALYMCLFVMYYNALFVLKEPRIFRANKLIPLFAVNLLLIVSTSTGAFFAYLIFLGIVFVFSFLKDLKEYTTIIRKNLLKLSGFFIFIFSIFAALFPKVFLSTFFKFFVGLALTHWSFTIRLQGIFYSWQVFLDHPFFGVGLGGVGPYLYQQFSPEGELPKNLGELEMFDPTNVLTEILASLGLYGFIVFCILAFIVTRLFFRTIRLTSISNQERLQSCALFISLIVSMIVLQFNQGLFRTYLWIHTAMNVGFFLKLIKRDEGAKLLVK